MASPIGHSLSEKDSVVWLNDGKTSFEFNVPFRPLLCLRMVETLGHDVSQHFLDLLHTVNW